MVGKKINPRRGKKAGIMPMDSREKMLKRIKNNYALFGCTDSFYIMDFTLVFNKKPRFGNEFVDVIDCARFKAFRDGYGNIKIDPNLDTYKENQCSYKVSSHHLYVSNEDTYNFYSRDTSIMSEVSLKFNSNGDSAGFDAYTEYTENDAAAKMSKITNIEIDDQENTIPLRLDDTYHLIIIFPNVKSAPLVRLYLNKDINVNGRVYVDSLIDFEDSKPLYNSYFRKCDIMVEERTIVAQNKDIECMKYNDKADDVLQYLRHESYISDPIVHDIQYKNDLGISAVSYEASESKHEGAYDTIYKVMYKDHEIYGTENSSSLKDGKMVKAVIDYSKKFLINEDGSFSEESYFKNNCTDVTKDKDIIEKVSSIYNGHMAQFVSTVTDCTDIDGNVVVENLDRFKYDIYSDNSENRLFLNIINDIFTLNLQIIYDTILYYTLSVGNEYSTTSYVYLVDISNDYPDPIFKITKNYQVTNTGTMYKINYDDKNRLRYYIMNNVDMSTGKVLSTYYSGPECTVSVEYSEDGKPVLKYLDSLIYAASDYEVYIRDELGIPSPLAIR